MRFRLKNSLQGRGREIRGDEMKSARAVIDRPYDYVCAYTKQ